MPFKRAMAYGRKYRSLARGLNKGRKYARPVVNTAILAAKAYTMAKALKRSNNIEYKYYDHSQVAGVTSSGFTVSVIPIPQGITDVTRIGDSLKLQNLTMRYMLTLNATIPTNNFCRVMVIHDDQNKVTAVSDVLQYTGAQAPISSKDYDKRFQSKILYDHVHNLNTSNIPQVLVDKVIRLGWHTQYSAGSTNVSTGDLKILCISNVATNQPAISFLGRISYTDN